MKLEDLERAIDEGLASYREMGRALKAIRDRRLYHAAYGTWDRYCKRRWKISGRHGNRLIQAGEIAALMGPMGPTPANERQAREVLRAPAGLRRAIAEQIQGPAKPTAAQIRQTVDSLARQSTEEKLATASAAEQEARARLEQAERESTLSRIERLAGRVRELHATLPTAAAADVALDDYLRVVRNSSTLARAA